MMGRGERTNRGVNRRTTMNETITNQLIALDIFLDGKNSGYDLKEAKIEADALSKRRLNKKQRELLAQYQTQIEEDGGSEL